MSRVTPLKIAIVSSGISQKEIAATIGCHESHLSRIVNGLGCDDETKRAIAAVLGRPVGDLWLGHGAESDQTDSGLNYDRLSEAA